MIKKPVILYLDTSDFYELYKDNISPELTELKSYLIEKTNSGEVITGYSYPIIFEFLQAAEERHREDRLKRASFLRKICKNNAHPHPADLIKGHRLPNHGLWMPRETADRFSPNNLRKLFKKQQSESAADKSQLTRAQRRSLQSRKGIKKLVQQSPRLSIKKRDFQDVPISDEFIEGRYLERYWGGEISASVVSNALTKWLFDPEFFFQLWYEYAGQKNPLTSLVEEKFEQISKKLKLALDSMDAAKKQYAAAKKSRSEYYSMLRNIDLPHAVKAKLSPPKLENLTPIKASLNFDLVFGKGRGEHFDAYLDEVLTENHQPQPSDLVDLLHLLYLTDVDLFRCDRKMSNLVKRKNIINGHKIVASRLDIPARVESLIVNRS